MTTCESKIVFPEPGFGASVSGSSTTLGVGSPSRPRPWAARHWPRLPPFGYELVVSLAGLDAILRADAPVVVTLELTPRMNWAMLEEVDALVLNTALETRLGPFL